MADIRITLVFLVLLCYLCSYTEGVAVCNTVYCKVDPCTFADPFQCGNHNNIECRANYCGGCNVEWWQNGVLLTDCVDFTLG